jgi:CDP-glycerol glycerophosphotransferase (TagB/SpsB family)
MKNIFKKKFCFLVHEELILTHYESLFKLLDKKDFDIIFTNDLFENINLNNTRFDHLNDVTVNVNDCHIKSERYKYCISANPVTLGTIQSVIFYKISNFIFKYILRLLKLLTLKSYSILFINRYKWLFNLNTTLADKQIRFMYGMDHNDEWSLQKWNHHYDIILCHTTYDKELIEAKFNAKTFIMGYPRYDSFFNLDDNNPKIIDLQNEFKIDKSKKTLLWMPTMGGNISSIPIYAEHIKNLEKIYNIIVRPHPISFRLEKEFIKILEKFNFKIDNVASRQTNYLFYISDLVIVDNGGVPFSCLYLKKRFIFLKEIKNNYSKLLMEKTYLNNTVENLKNEIPIFNIDNISEIQLFFDNKNLKSYDDIFLNLHNMYFKKTDKKNSSLNIKLFLEKL